MNRVSECRHYVFWLILAVALGLDAFSVALGAGFVAFGLRRRIRLAWHFGFFQFAMPLLGWQIARVISAKVGMSAKWVGAALLFFIGTRMVYASVRAKDDVILQPRRDPTKGWMLVSLSLATSLDALGVGFSFGLLVSDLLNACLLIGVVAFVLTYLGMSVGNLLSSRIGIWAEVVAGGVLIMLGLRMLLF